MKKDINPMSDMIRKFLDNVKEKSGKGAKVFFIDSEGEYLNQRGNEVGIGNKHKEERKGE